MYTRVLLKGGENDNMNPWGGGGGGGGGGQLLLIHYLRLEITSVSSIQCTLV